MPNSETVKETKSKQPTGSSKRKRKQSIKRNITFSNESSSNDGTKSSKSERAYGKRLKAEKGKLGKDHCETATGKNEGDVEESPCPVHVKVECVDSSENDVKDNCKNSRSSESTGTQCSSSKQQCQNCKFCSEHLVDKQDGDNSKDKLRNKKKFTCEICAKDGSTRVYNSVEKHKHHMATVHEIYTEEIKRFECTDCSEAVWFPTKAKFIYHLGTKHPGIIKFICEICTETFKLKANYKNHMKTHNIVVQKKFSCDVCNGTFVNKAGYEAHKKRFPGLHSRQSCTHCGFSFSREKHMKNHRCKTLLLEEAAARANNAQQTPEPVNPPVDESSLKLAANVELKNTVEDNQVFTDSKKLVTEMGELPEKKLTNDVVDPQTNKRVVLHRIVPRRSQDQAVYRPVQMQTQNVPESVVVQELREINFEGGTFIAAAAADTDQQFIVRDVNGHLLQGNQILQLDINDIQPGEESQVYLADWNIVAPYVIREKSP